MLRLAAIPLQLGLGRGKLSSAVINASVTGMVQFICLQTHSSKGLNSDLLVNWSDATKHCNSLQFSIMAPPKTIIVGAGVAGIAMSHTLKWKLGYNDFEVSIILIPHMNTDRQDL